MSAHPPSQVPAALPSTAARRRAARALRDLNREFLAYEADDATLDALNARVQALGATLRAGEAARTRSMDEIAREPEAAPVDDGAEIDHFDGCFVTGQASPFGLAAPVRRAGAGLHARVRFHRGFEGMPGYAHGGIVMAVFDDLIGMTIGRLMRVPAPTVHVETDFRAPIPLERTVDVHTELVRQDGRKRTVTATATIDGRVHAQALGLLVVLDPDRPIFAR